MSPSAGDAFLLYKTIFKDELYALIKTPEHERFHLTYKEKKIIRNNNDKMAEYAAQYYINKFGVDLDDKNLVQVAIDKTIRETLRRFK